MLVMRQVRLMAGLGLISSVYLVEAVRTFTIANACSFTVWPAVYTDPSSPSRPSGPTGWNAPSGSSRTLQVPDDWTSGRIWGRTDCDPEGNCASGSCIGGIECDPHVGTGDAPASLAEWTLSAGSVDFYDVSLVDGYNLPMSISNNVGCSTADCATNLLPSCPAQLAATNNGTVVGCKSSCDLTSRLANSPDCCTGSHDTPQTCPPTGVQFYSFFKSNCRNSYVYAYDESSGTALWACDVSKKADYTLTFCPDNKGTQLSADTSASASATPFQATSDSSSVFSGATSSSASAVATSVSHPQNNNTPKSANAKSPKACRAKFRRGLVGSVDTSAKHHRVFRRHRGTH